MLEHLAYEEGVAAGDAVKPRRIDSVLTDEALDRMQAQRWQRQRCGTRRSCGVAEQRAQRVADTDLVVTDDPDGQGARLRDAPQHKPQKIDRALIRPVQVIDDEHRRCGT